MSDKIINLGQFTSPGVGILAGRQRGALVRQQTRLDDADRTGATVTVIIPDDLYSVNSSFFLGMFEKSIIDLGPDTFRQRYQFVGPDAEFIREEGIREAQLLGTPFEAMRRTA